MNKYFLYARKSTDVEDKQVLSIEAQLMELLEFAKRENLEIVDVLVEKQSAKIPGRPIFNNMLTMIERGEADSILAWNPDRLARNSVDGGKIIYLLDCGHIQSLKFLTFWYDNTSQGKFILNIAFDQSKYLKSQGISNLRLASRAVRGEPVFPYLSALRAAESVGQKSESLILVPEAGVEPACLAASDFKSLESTNFSTRANN